LSPHPHEVLEQLGIERLGFERQCDRHGSYT
jgi:hypothetical protein